MGKNQLKRFCNKGYNLPDGIILADLPVYMPMARRQAFKRVAVF